MCIRDRVNRIWADITPEVSSYTLGKSANTQIKEAVFTIKPGEEFSLDVYKRQVLS